MTTLLEINRAESPVLRACFQRQRQELRRAGVDVVYVDLVGASKGRVMDVAREVQRADSPDGVLLRGVDLVGVFHPITSAEIFVDHCTRCIVNKHSPLKSPLRDTRVFCHSEKSQTRLHSLGVHKTIPISGHHLPKIEREIEDPSKIWVAFLDTCSRASDVLMKLMKLREQQKWPIEVVTTIRHGRVWECDNPIEAAQGADIIVAPYEDLDYGEPNDGVILAHACRIPIVTRRTSAVANYSIPSKMLKVVPKDAPGAYAAAVGSYIRSSRDNVWPIKSDTVDSELVQSLLRML